MPDSHRALHYIYSRSMVNKSKNFTHFAQKDYYMLASFLAGQQRNVGEIIFNEMRRFRFSSSKSATIPYPQIVSFILMKNKIWYLEGTERVIIPRFGKTQLTHMSINLPVSRTKATSQREATPSRGDEAQSSAQGQVPPPSFLNASLSTYLTEVINQAVSGLKKELVTEYEKLVDKMELQVLKLVEKANTNFDLMFKTQDDMSRRITDMEILLRSHFPTTSSEVPPETTPASTSPPHPQTHVLFTDPDSNVDVTYDRSPSLPPSASVPPPSSPPFVPIDPSTAMVPFDPSSDIIFPQPPSDVDKTGEKEV